MKIFALVSEIVDQVGAKLDALLYKEPPKRGAMSNQRDPINFYNLLIILMIMSVFYTLYTE